MRFSYPADHPLTAEFEEQRRGVSASTRPMADGEYMSVHHPDEPHATALAMFAVTGGNVGQILFVYRRDMPIHHRDTFHNGSDLQVTIEDGQRMAAGRTGTHRRRDGFANPFGTNSGGDAVGRVLTVGRVYWYPNYQVIDEIQELREKLMIVFKGEN